MLFFKFRVFEFAQIHYKYEQIFEKYYYLRKKKKF